MLPPVIFILRKTKEANKPLFYLFIILKTISSFLFITDLLAYKFIIDAASKKTTIAGLSFTHILIILLIYFLLYKILTSVIEYLANLLDVDTILFLNKLLVKKIESLDLATFENPQSVGLMKRAFDRFQFQCKLYFHSIMQAYTAIIESCIALIIFFFVSPIIGLIMLICNIIPVIVRSKFSQGIFNIYKADDETKRKFLYLSQTLIDRTTLPEIKLFNAFHFFQDRMINIYRQFTKNQLNEEKKSTIWVTISEFIPIFSIFIFWFVTGIQYQNGLITSGTFVIFFINSMAFFSRLKMLSQNLGDLNSSSLLMKDAIDFFDIKPNITFPHLNHEKKIALLKILKKPTIAIENVSFQYPNSQTFALKNIHFTIPYGQNIAIVGENGAGKSTLIKLLLRMYDPTNGIVRINGINIKKIPEDILMLLYSTLFQSFGKFYLTVKENIELAAGEKLSDEQIKKYLAFSNAWKFIKNTKSQVNQQLGPEYKGGIDLSGGEWQRLAIARAHAKQAPVLILDEPTSAVDAKSEMEIFDRLIAEMEENTLIFISHRFSTIKDAQRIVVIDKGQMIEDGTHEQLIKNKNKYAQLYTIQAERYLREK